MNRILTGHSRRAVTTATLVVLGGAVTAAVWIGGDHGFAVALGIFYAVAGIIAYVIAGGSSDVAAIMRTDGDERQHGIDHEAMRISGLAMAATGIVGTIVQTARGNDPAGFAWICTVGGITYIVALAVLRRRR
jgi:hypothetical protein